VRYAWEAPCLLLAACEVGHQCGGGINNTTEQKGGQ
jgi:hypothetical protein